jgi:hypothetical protein
VKYKGENRRWRTIMSTDCAWSGRIYFSYYLILYLFYKDYIELEASSIDLINKNSSTFVINLLVEVS